MFYSESRKHERHRERPPGTRCDRDLVSRCIGSLSEPEQDPETVYVLVDNRITIDENTTVEELEGDVARVASTPGRLVTQMSNSTVVDELVDLFQDYDLVGPRSRTSTRKYRSSSSMR